MLFVFAACGETGPQGSGDTSQNAEPQASYVFTPQETLPWVHFLKDGTVAAVNDMDLFFVNADNALLNTIALPFAPSQLAFNDSDGAILTQRGVRGNIKIARVNDNWRLFDFTVWNADGEKIYTTPTMPKNTKEGTEEKAIGYFVGDGKVVFAADCRMFLLDYRTQELKLLHSWLDQEIFEHIGKIYPKDDKSFYFQYVGNNRISALWESDFEGNKKLLYEGGRLTYANGNLIFTQTYSSNKVEAKKTDAFLLDKASGTFKLLFTSENGISSVGVDDPGSGLISFTVLVPDDLTPHRLRQNHVAVDTASGEVLAQTSVEGTLIGAKKIDGQILFFYVPFTSHNFMVQNCTTGEVKCITSAKRLIDVQFSPDYTYYVHITQDESGVKRFNIKKVELA